MEKKNIYSNPLSHSAHTRRPPHSHLKTGTSDDNADLLNGGEILMQDLEGRSITPKEGEDILKMTPEKKQQFNRIMQTIGKLKHEP